MKKTMIVMLSLFMLVFLVGNVFAYGWNSEGMRGKGFGKNQGGQAYSLYDDTQVNHQTQIDTYPIEELTQEEIDGLLLMREEEKLARDVYLELYDIFGQQIFSNIAQSEQTHTNAIKSLLDKYDLDDPVISDERGVFTNQELETLYNQLVEQGSVSLLDALKVGATIEDLDIKDLQELNEITDNQDISEVYNNLEKGSRNHLRSFVGVIEKNGGTYEPQYITEDYYNSIISDDMETGTEYNSRENMNQGNRGSQAMGGNTQQQKSQNVFSRMWNGLKNWFK